MVKQADLLIVEDSPSDAKLLMRAMERTAFTKTVHLVRNGQAALDFLHNRPPYALSPRPDLILLDLNLPMMSGFEVLSHIKANDALRIIPVVIMTTSQDAEDILKSYREYANSYIVKPNSTTALTTMVETLEQFWFTVAKLP